MYGPICWLMVGLLHPITDESPKHQTRVAALGQAPWDELLHPALRAASSRQRNLTTRQSLLLLFDYCVASDLQILSILGPCLR